MLSIKAAYRRSVLLLVGGAFFAQIISLLLAPVLTRLYTPSEFGEYSVLLSVVSILSVVATARYEMAVMLPRKDRDAQLVLLLSFCIAVLFAVFLCIALSVFYGAAAGLVGESYVFLIPVFVVVVGFSESAKVWLNRNKEYKRMAFNSAAQVSVGGGSQIFIYYLGFSGVGLVIGQLVGSFFSLYILLAGASKHFKKIILRRELVRLRGLFNRYIFMLKYGVPALLASRAAQESLVLLASYYLGAGVVGYLSLLSRIIGMPSTLISASLSGVFYKEITLVKKAKSYPVVKRFTLILAALSLPVFALFYVCFEVSFVFIFGDSWRGALNFAPYLFLVACFSFVFSPLTVLFNYYEIQGWNLVWQLMWLLLTILIFWLYGYLSLDVFDLFFYYAVCQSFLYIIGIAFVLMYARALYVE